MSRPAVRPSAPLRRRAGALLLALAALPAAAGVPEEVAQLKALVKAQGEAIAALQARLAEVEGRATGIDQRVQVAERQVAGTTELAARVDAIETASDAGSSGGGATAASWAQSTTLGGYGELHFSNLDADDSNRDLEQADFHRFVLFFGHRFDERLTFNAELELEHAKIEDSGDSAGEVELEQAYIDYRLDDTYTLRAGQFLLPVGLLNETHEPPTFYGVERNDVENVIIPTTWWEGGLGASATYANGFGWDVAMHTGLAIPVEGGDAFRVREGRQAVSEASARNLAYTGRLRYQPMPGIDLAAAFQYQDDASQARRDGLDEAWLVVLNANVQRGPFGLRALWARWNLEGDAAKAADADEQTGWYVEPSWRFDTPSGAAGLYARYEDIEGARLQDRFDQWELGVNWHPHEDVVLKADLRRRQHDLTSEEGRDFEGFDLGVGYRF